MAFKPGVSNSNSSVKKCSAVHSLLEEGFCGTQPTKKSSK
jgi:hypothetical protein